MGGGGQRRPGLAVSQGSERCAGLDAKVPGDYPTKIAMSGVGRAGRPGRIQGVTLAGSCRIVAGLATRSVTSGTVHRPAHGSHPAGGARRDGQPRPFGERNLVVVLVSAIIARRANRWPDYSAAVRGDAPQQHEHYTYFKAANWQSTFSIHPISRSPGYQKAIESSKADP